jgi:hypothetical protein
MVVPAAVGTALRTLFDQLVQWAMQSPERTALLIGAGLVTLFVGQLIGIRLSRWTVRTLLQSGVWLGSTTWDVVADTVRRWRAPSVSATATQLGDGTESHSTASELSEEGTREHLRIRPTSAEYDPETLVMALHGLQSHHRRTEISGNWRRTDQDTFEFLVATRGVDAGVEFYIGGSMSLDRLAATLPYRQCGFDVDCVSTHPTHLLAQSPVAEGGDDTSPSEPGTTAPRPPSPATAADGGATAATEEGTTDIAVYLDGDLQPLERLVDGLQDGELQPPKTAASASRDVETDRHTAGHDTDGAETTTAERAGLDRDDLTPKQASVADFVRFLDGPAPDEIETTDADTLEAGLRSDRVLDVYQTVEAQHGRPVYQGQSDLARELSKYLGFVSKEERDPTTPEERYTRWNGLRWTNESVSTIAEKLVAETDKERIDELVEMLETTVPPSE